MRRALTVAHLRLAGRECMTVPRRGITVSLEVDVANSSALTIVDGVLHCLSPIPTSLSPLGIRLGAFSPSLSGPAR